MDRLQGEAIHEASENQSRRADVSGRNLGRADPGIALESRKEDAEQSSRGDDLLLVIKVMATTVGETAADFLGINLHLGLGTLGTSAVFLLTILSVVTYLSITRRDQTPALEPA